MTRKVRMSLLCREYPEDWSYTILEAFLKRERCFLTSRCKWKDTIRLGKYKCKGNKSQFGLAFSSSHVSSAATRSTSINTFMIPRWVTVVVNYLKTSQNTDVKENTENWPKASIRQFFIINHLQCDLLPPASSVTSNWPGHWIRLELLRKSRHIGIVPAVLAGWVNQDPCLFELVPKNKIKFQHEHCQACLK